MYRQIECISLRTVRHSDSHSILTAYSRELGRLSLSLPAGKGRGAMRLRSLLMPLGRFECVADMRPNREIHPMRDVRPLGMPPVADPVRSSVALFIADFLTGVLREQATDQRLYAFLDEAVSALSDTTSPLRLSSPSLANFHICFLVRLTRYLGIEPDASTYLPGRYFDMGGGVFTPFPPATRNFLPAGESEMAATLLRLTFRNMGRLRLSRFERNTILDRLLQYYRTHFPSIAEPRSLDILRM